jgi:hypothetical protein
MRNTVQYPITVEETIEVLERLSWSLAFEQRCGDMRPLILTKLVQGLKEHPELFDELVKDKT